MKGKGVIFKQARPKRLVDLESRINHACSKCIHFLWNWLKHSRPDLGCHLFVPSWF